MKNTRFRMYFQFMLKIWSHSCTCVRIIDLFHALVSFRFMLESTWIKSIIRTQVHESCTSKRNMYLCPNIWFISCTCRTKYDFLHVHDNTCTLAQKSDLNMYLWVFSFSGNYVNLSGKYMKKIKYSFASTWMWSNFQKQVHERVVRDGNTY